VLREVGVELRGEDSFHRNDVRVFFGEQGEGTGSPSAVTGPERAGCTFMAPA
jgi:hypothetical protein